LKNALAGKAGTSKPYVLTCVPLATS
jgi:hypothetical protein